ncbi:hypothetical protein C8R45DRAFT_1053016 [Mycena sanguinolenta]|nr:hypothetical protein C8R45DRAFT_1053016 [Mycena sanguinolenta]
MQDEYLAEFIHLEGRGDVCNTHCPTCPADAPREMPRFRCMDCDTPDLFCLDCCVHAHASHLLDRIECWEGGRFKRVSLQSLGLRVQLGHCWGEPCPQPRPGHKKSRVIHTNGIHDVSVDFCRCRDELLVGSRRQQLLRQSWYPATHREPQTCTTFRTLEQFHIMTLQGKVTAYDYYSGLEKLTDNTGLSKVKDRYKAFMRTMRQWHHLAMLKRGGRGNDVWELAVVCPACPQPGVNLPTDWNSATGERRFLYILYIAIDACFRLKRRIVSNERKDPGLGTEWSYFAEDAPFREYLRSVTDQKEMSTCSGLAALDYANTKFSRGYSSMGVGLSVCAWHEFVQPNSAGDLQKGERYANMDYILGSLLRHHHALLIKFFKKLIERMKQMPPLVRWNLVEKLLRFVIPKLHIYSHKLLCRLFYSLNYTPGSARINGEGIERPWANIGPVATSMREMGPGSWHDTLDDHWGHWNRQKLVGLGALLRKRLLKAIPERNYQQDSFATFTENQVEHVAGWKLMVEVFEADNKKPNPYELPKSGLNENDVRLELVQEEVDEQSKGILPIHNVSPSAFIIAGLDLEEQQRCIKVAVVTHKNASSKITADIIEKRTKLARYTARFHTAQAVYMPGALQALAEIPDGAGGEEATWAENVPLLLPSALSPELREAGCNKGVTAIEVRLRDAQCRSALDEIINYLHIKSRFRTYKSSQVRHQGATTCARNSMNCNDEKLRMQAEKYVAAWEAKRTLVGEANVGWHRLNPKKDLQCMDDEDDRAVRSKRKRRGMKRQAGQAATAEDMREGVVEGQRRKDPTGERWRMISWIWMSAETSGAATTEAVLTGLRSTEEVLLRREEMCRVPVSLQKRAEWWRARGTNGIRGQADLYNDLAQHFEDLWQPVRGLEVVEDQEWSQRDVGSAIEEGDEDDGNDGVDGEGDDGMVVEEEEGSVGGESGGEEGDEL